MRVKIRVEDGNRFISIPIPIRQLRDLYDALYMPDENWHRNLRLNKCDEQVYDFHYKLEWVIHDVIDRGVSYYLQQPRHHFAINGKHGKITKVKKELVRFKGRSYLVKMPRWRIVKNENKNENRIKKS